MAIQFLGQGAVALYSIPSAEIGINIKDYSLDVTPEFRLPINNIGNEVDGMAIGNPKGDLKFSAETKAITTAGCIALANFYTPFVMANRTDYFGRSQGGMYVVSLSFKASRGAWAELDASLESHWNLA